MTYDKQVQVLKSILTSTQGIVYLYDLDKGEICFLNQVIYNQLGCEKFEMDTIQFEVYVNKIHPTDQDRYRYHIKSVISGREKKFASIEYRLKNKNGDWKWFSDSIFFLISESLKSRELVGYATDVNQIRKKEEKYIREGIRLTAILNNTREYYIFLDPDYKIQSLNKNAKEFLSEKYNRSIFEGYSILEFLPLESAVVFLEKFNYALTGTPIQYESNFKSDTTDEMKWYQFRYLPIRDKKERITGICFIFMDMTEIRNSNESLKELNRNLEDIVEERTKELKAEVAQREKTENMLVIALEKEKELNELKTKFITMVSHEFRTPMTALSTSTQLLEDYGDKYNKMEMEKHFHRIKEAISSLTNLMEGVLSINRFEAANFPFQPAYVDLRNFLNNLISNFESVYPANKFELNLLENDKSLYNFDTNLITHILENLLNNAIKYSPNKEIITLEVIGSEKTIEFIVKDLGLGIPKEDQGQIFQTFYRGKNVGNIPGTGLGLNLTKNFVELHGGTIYFKSILGKGTQFHVVIPQ